MHNSKFKIGFKKRRKQHKSLGYYDKIIVAGKLMTVKTAVANYPVELFNMMDNGVIKLGRLVYVSLLQKIKAIDPNTAAEHRKKYQAPFVYSVSKRYNYEVDFVVRHILQNAKLDVITIKTGGNIKTYTSLNSFGKEVTSNNINHFYFYRENGVYKIS